MSNKKQTAVEWLWEQIDNTIPFQNIEASQIFNGLLEQAKELEKQQHEETWYDSTLQFDNAAQMTNKKLFEDYYTETYKQQA